MKILDPNWLLKPPFDYELKKYIFMSAYVRFENAISNNQFFSTLNEIEFHLNKLYKLKYQKDELDNNNKVVIGIDLDLMDLEYEYREGDDNLNDIYKIVDFTIIKLEALHKKLRNRWRMFSDKIKITEIPDKKPTKKKGIVFIVLEDHIKIYSYIKPENIKDDWRSLVFKEVGQVENSLRKIAEFISASERISNDNRFWRFDIKNLEFQKISYTDTILPIIIYNLYHKLKFN